MTDWADEKAREFEQSDGTVDDLAALLREVANDPKCSSVYDDFCKCYDLSMQASSYWPELPGSFGGKVSERLNVTLTAEHQARMAAEEKLAEVRRVVEGVREILGALAVIEEQEEE